MVSVHSLTGGTPVPRSPVPATTARRVHPGAAPAIEAVGMVPGIRGADTTPYVATQPDCENHGYGGEVL